MKRLPSYVLIILLFIIGCAKDKNHSSKKEGSLLDNKRQAFQKEIILPFKKDIDGLHSEFEKLEELKKLELINELAEYQEYLTFLDSIPKDSMLEIHHFQANTVKGKAWINKLQKEILEKVKIKEHHIVNFNKVREILLNSSTELTNKRNQLQESSRKFSERKSNEKNNYQAKLNTFFKKYSKKYNEAQGFIRNNSNSPYYYGNLDFIAKTGKRIEIFKKNLKRASVSHIPLLSRRIAPPAELTPAASSNLGLIDTYLKEIQILENEGYNLIKSISSKKMYLATEEKKLQESIRLH